jgi:hypothetical protein
MAAKARKESEIEKQGGLSQTDWVEARVREIENYSSDLHRQNEEKKQRGEKVDLEIPVITDELILKSLVEFVRVRKIPPTEKERINACLANRRIGEAIEALVLVDDSRAISRNARLPERRRSLVAHSGDKKMAMNDQSPTFELGTDSHFLTEIQDVKTLKEIIIDSGGELKIENGQVMGIIFRKNRNQLLLFPGEGEEVSLEEPLPLKNDDEGLDGWAKRVLGETIIEIGEMPTKPNDVERLFKDKIRSAALVRIVEVCHFIFGNYGSMGVTEKVGDTKIIRAEGISGFQAINWLSIATRITKDGEAGKNEGGKKGTLIELSLGEISLKTGKKESGTEKIKIFGGELDVCELKIKGMGKIPETMRMFEKRSQRLRQSGGERMGRNIRTLLKLLSEGIGVEELIKRVNLTIIDYKFLIGDGKYHLALNKELLPGEGHQKQVREYIFLIICQLYRLYREEKDGLRQKVSKKEVIGRDPGSRKQVIPIRIGDVVKFAKEFGLMERITARLDYQIPGENKIYEIRAKDGRELGKWAKELLENRLKILPEQRRARMLKILEQALFPGEDLKILRKTKNHPTEEISGWCVEYRGNNYLILSEVWERLRGGELKIDRTVKYENGVVAFWFLVPDPKSSNGRTIEIRLALDKNGRFRITGLPSVIGPVDGSISSTWELKAVMERHSDQWADIETNFWAELVKNTNNWIEVATRIPDGKMVDQNGRLRKVIPGKPIVCKYDYFTAGIWVIDKALLAAAVEEIERLGLDDDWGIVRLANMMAIGEEGPAFCPIPFHDNTETEAGSVLPEIIHCFECGNIGKPRDPDKIIHSVPLTGGESPEDYQEVEKARHEAMSSFLRLTQNLARDEVFGDFSTYLGSRGLEPADVAEWCGYMPRRVSRFLHDVFYQAYVLTEKKSECGWEELEPMKIREFLEKAKITQLLNRMNRKSKSTEWLEVEPEWFDGLFGQITIRDLRSWDKFRLIGRDKAKNDLYGGRLTFMTQWIQHEHGVRASNINGRGVGYRDDRGYELQLFEGHVVHRKAFIKERRRHDEGGRVVRQTPPGFYIPDFEKFRNRPIRRLIIMEGPITAASAWKLMPEWKEDTLVMYGLLPKQILAILKWIGVSGYEAKNHPSLGKNIEEVVLAFDFDWGGMTDFKQIKGALNRTFPNLKVTEVLELLRGTPWEKYARPHDIADDDEEKIYPKKDAGFGGGKKRDWNDILRMRLGIIEDEEELIPETDWLEVLEELESEKIINDEGWEKRWLEFWESNRKHFGDIAAKEIIVIKRDFFKASGRQTVEGRKKIVEQVTQMWSEENF